MRSLRLSAERCIRKAINERDVGSGAVGLADATAEDEAASWWADCRFAGPMGIDWPGHRPRDATAGLTGLPERSSRGLFDVVMPSGGASTPGSPHPALQGRSLTDRGVTSEGYRSWLYGLLRGHELSRAGDGSRPVAAPSGRVIGGNSATTTIRPAPHGDRPGLASPPVRGPTA